MTRSFLRATGALAALASLLLAGCGGSTSSVPSLSPGSSPDGVTRSVQPLGQPAVDPSADGRSGDAERERGLPAHVLYVAVPNSNVIDIYDAANGRKVGSYGGLNSPVAVALDRRGTLYAVDRGNFRIAVYPQDRPSRPRFLPNPNKGAGIAVNRAGDVAVANYSTGTTGFQKGNVLLFHHGAGQPTVLSDPTIGTVQSVAIDARGNVFVDGLLEKPDFTITYIGEFPAGSTKFKNFNTSELGIPGGLAVDPRGNLLVDDESGNAVLVYPPGATTAANRFSVGSIAGQAVVVQIALSHDARTIYSTDYNDGLVYEYSYPGTSGPSRLLRTISSEFSADGIAVAPPAVPGAW